MNLNTEQVKNFLPHRSPFLFIDSVEEISLTQSQIKESKDLIGCAIKASFEVKENLKVLEGHFPGNPILPGVVQVEMMAQACAFTSMPLVQSKGSDCEVETLLLGVEKSKFRKQVFPGMKLKISTKMIKCRASIASYDCEVHCEGEKVSEATILARLVISNKEK